MKINKGMNMKKYLLAILLLIMAFPAFATVSTETTRVAYTCNGTSTNYAYTFKILADADLKVIKTLTATGAETTLTLATDYTVTGAGTASGNVVLTAGSKCASGYTMTILRDMDVTQETDYVDGEAFSAESIESALDKNTMILQQLKEEVGRAPKLPTTSTITDIALPNPTANHYIGWNTTGTNLTNISNPVASTATQYEIDALVSYGGGTAYTQATIAAALTAIGTTNKATLLLRPGTWVISSNADWSAYTNVTFKIVPGAKLSGSFTVTFPTDPEAGLYQIFDSSLTVAGLRRAYPEWFATNTTPGTTDMSTALRGAVSSLLVNGTLILSNTYSIVPSTATHTQPNYLSPGGADVIISYGIDVTKNLVIRGENYAELKMNRTGNTAWGTHIYVKSANLKMSGVKLYPSGTEAEKDLTFGLYIEGTSGTPCEIDIKNNTFDDFFYAIHGVDYIQNTYISDNIFLNTTNGAARTLHGGSGIMFNGVRYARNIHITNNQLTAPVHPLGDGINFNSRSSGITGKEFTDTGDIPRYVTISGNTIRGYKSSGGSDGLGIALAAGWDTTISNNIIADCSDGVHIEITSNEPAKQVLRNILISGNNISECIGGNITIVQPNNGVATENILVTGNHLSQYAAGGINLSIGAYLSRKHDLVVSNNYFNGQTSYDGIYILNYDANTPLIKDNTFIRCARALRVDSSDYVPKELISQGNTFRYNTTVFYYEDDHILPMQITSINDVLSGNTNVDSINTGNYQNRLLFYNATIDGSTFNGMGIANAEYATNSRRIIFSQTNTAYTRKTYELLDTIYYYDPLVKGFLGEVCTEAGTGAGAIGATTAAVVNGTATITLSVNDARVGEYIDIATASTGPYKIISQAAGVSTLHKVTDATTGTRAVTLHAPVFNTFGAVTP